MYFVSLRCSLRCLICVFIIRRPPISTRTDTLVPLHDALPIWFVMIVTLMIYYVTPWLRWDRGPYAPDQAVLIDLAGRRFYMFGIEIWPHEFYFVAGRSEEHTSELQSLMRISYVVLCLKKKTDQISLTDSIGER